MAKADEQSSSAEWFRKYSEHLQSPEWKAIRELVIKRCKGICEGCGVSDTEQVHHLTYDTYNKIGREMLFELVGVCKPCHEAIHGRKLNDEPGIAVEKEQPEPLLEWEIRHQEYRKQHPDKKWF